MKEIEVIREKLSTSELFAHEGQCHSRTAGPAAVCGKHFGVASFDLVLVDYRHAPAVQGDL